MIYALFQNTIKNSTNIVRESGDPGRDATFAMQGQMEDPVAVIKGQVIKCLEIIEIIRVNQDQTDANAKATEYLLDRVNDNANAALDHVFKQLARYEKALRRMPPVAGAAGGAPRALICKPDLALKLEELTSDMSPVVFACWLDAFVAYYDASNMQVKELAVQQAYFKACFHPSLYGRIEAFIMKGQTPILGRNGACSILKNEFLAEHPLFSRRLDFFRFKQGYGQSMSDAMAELQKLGDQATLGALDATDLYIMRYLTMTDDPKLLEKMLEKELPTQQNLIDIVRRFENASRTHKNLSTASANAVEEAEANFVGKGRGRGRGRQDQDQGKAGKKEWKRPDLPYTEEQAQIILAWYRTQFLCCKCGGKRNPKEIHSCPAQKVMCNKCKRTSHYEAHCFAKWKAPNEKAVSQSVLQTADSGDYLDAESDTSYVTATGNRL
jgi:ribosomal protein S27E